MMRGRNYEGVGFFSALGYFVTGAAMGAVAGLWFAPRSGEDLREGVGDWIRDKKEQGKEYASQMKDKMSMSRENEPEYPESRGPEEPLASDTGNFEA